MVVEDNPAYLYLIRKAFETQRGETRWILTAASDGEEALRLLFEEEDENVPLPELILLDWNLPRTNGEEVLVKAAGKVVRVEDRLEDGNMHTRENLPFIVAGKGGGSLKTGRFLTGIKGNQGDLLTTLLACMGVSLDRPLGIATKQIKEMKNT